MITKDIYDNVVAAMQPAEELGGPEGADYMGLMARIATDAIQRMQTYSSTAMLPRLAALSQGELLAVQGFEDLAEKQLVRTAPLPPGVTLAPHFGMALRKAFDDGWWLVEHAPLFGGGEIDQENWGTLECAPRVSCYRTEAAADWLIEQLAKPEPKELGEARMWGIVDHAYTVDELEKARAELRDIVRRDAAAAVAHDERDVVAPAGNEQRQNEIAARRSAQDDAVAEREREVEWIVTYAIATYEGSITVWASEDADREHIIARAEAALTRKAGPLPLGYRSYQIERSHDGASR